MDTILPLCSSSKIEKLYSIPPYYFRAENDYDSILLNNEWPILRTIVFNKNSPEIITCRHHGGGYSHLRLYSPRPPHHNLSAEQTDQLSHCIINPRITRLTK